MRNSVTLLLCCSALASLTACRQDMHNQPRYKPFAESDFFQDHRSERPQVEGTVARGHLHVDKARYTGRIGNADVDTFPFQITRDDLARGQQRFNIYCSPCHSRLGDGNGLVVQRGFRQPPSYYTERLKTIPVGHFFDVITNGFGAMASYASRVSPDDRWRIAAYIRALQYSESAKMDDVPADQRNNLATEPPLAGTGESGIGVQNPALDLPNPVPTLGPASPAAGERPAMPSLAMPTRGSSTQQGTVPGH